ncbi:MAG: methylmalonyl Co-A mutase-associated GTPase MeaB [Firmicutes bacterium]|nr:methylmalonyl Co-A mutase-associated GTPase MeaB [Bacillota bacterium]
MAERTLEEWAAAFRAGDRRALARALTWAEAGDGRAQRLLALVGGGGRRAHAVGVTGSPGVGKSSLVDRLAVALRRRGRTVGVVAVDPSSPFSGGAILGDRVRMAEAALDSGVFVRSLATRGRMGGLSAATGDAIRLMDAFGKDAVVVETVGAGQAEVDVMGLVDSVVVVLAPGLGDDVQAIKAGILEIADVLVVNKADRPGADLAVRELRQMLLLGGGRPEEADAGRVPGWEVPVLRTSATTGEGVEELADALDRHRQALAASGAGAARRLRAAEGALADALARTAVAEVRRAAPTMWEEAVRRLADGEASPAAAAHELWAAARGARSGGRAWTSP